MEKKLLPLLALLLFAITSCGSKEAHTGDYVIEANDILKLDICSASEVNFLSSVDENTTISPNTNYKYYLDSGTIQFKDKGLKLNIYIPSNAKIEITGVFIYSINLSTSFDSLTIKNEDTTYINMSDIHCQTLCLSSSYTNELNISNSKIDKLIINSNHVTHLNILNNNCNAISIDCIRLSVTLSNTIFKTFESKTRIGEFELFLLKTKTYKFDVSSPNFGSYIENCNNATTLIKIDNQYGKTILSYIE